MLNLHPHNPGHEMTDEQHRDEEKQVVKDALKEWLDEKFTIFGKWSAAAIAATTLAAIVYFIFWVEFKK